jgi:Fe-S cluster biogenesis protein NfuA
MYQAVEEIIAGEIRPQLQSHGGDIELIEVTTYGTVRVRLMGECAACPASHSTVENLVESVLRKKVPGIKEIVVVQSVSDELIRDALKILRKPRTIGS